MSDEFVRWEGKWGDDHERAYQLGYKAAEKVMSAIKDAAITALREEKMNKSKFPKKARVTITTIVDFASALSSLEMLIQVNDGCHFCEYDAERLDKMVVMMRRKMAEWQGGEEK